MWSNGTGGTFQLCQIADAMIGMAFDLQALRGESRILAVFFDLLKAILRTSRSLAGGSAAQVSAVAGLANISFADDVSRVDVAGGQLRPATSALSQFLWNEMSVSAMLEIRVDLRLLDVGSWRPTNADAGIADEHTKRWKRHQPTMEGFAKGLQRRLDQARFSILMGSSHGAILAPVWVTTTILNPLSSGRSSSISPHRYPIAPMEPRVIDASAGHRIEAWAERVQGQPGSLDMGMRRVLGAAASRLDPIDGFVDAVIAWENLFGTDEGESTFRIGGAMCALLAPDDLAERQVLFREIQALYGTRSGVVHGAREPDQRVAMVDRNRAVELALDCIRAVHDRPELVGASNSAMRGRMAILGF